MKNITSIIILTFIISFAHAQPCKQVKVGMTSTEVLKLVGKPTEIDSLGSNINQDGSRSAMVVWQYGEPSKDGNQRIEFSVGKVDNVIADGKKYDELMIAVRQKKIPREELTVRIEKLNREGCK